MLLRLDGAGPLHLQVYRSLREAILGGELRPGMRLPSTRSVAADYGVSRNTVLFAYDQLLGEGYATARRGSGTYVPDELPDDLVAAGASPDGDRVSRAAARPRFSRFARRVGALRWDLPRPGLGYDFTYGKPSLRDFPLETWSRFVSRRARRASIRDLDYGGPKGVRPLRQAIADYLRRARGVVCEPGQVVIVGGSQQGLDLVARLLVDPGDRVVLEEPHYPGARNAFAAAGARLVPVDVGASGLDIAALARVRAAKLLYVTPSHQFPTGVLMPVAQRLALLSWAERAGAYVFEDDYDSEYRYAGRPVASLQGLDRAGRVIYAGTFSKLMFPALRIGYLVLPEPLVEAFVGARRVTGFASPALEQLALADFIREGHFERHVRRARVQNAERRAAVIEAIRESLGDRAQVSGADAGLHVLVWLRGTSAEAVDRLVTRAVDRGVGIHSVRSFCLRKPKRPGFLLGYASATRAELRRGIAEIARLL